MAFEDSAGINVRNHYGPRVTNNKFGGDLPGDGAVRQVEYVFDYDQLPGNSLGEMEKLLPDNSTLIEALWITLDPFVGGTSYGIVMVEQNGTIISGGVLFDTLVLAEMDSIGETNLASTHTGATSGDGLGVNISPASQVSIASTGVFTAGRARLVLDYVPYKAA